MDFDVEDGEILDDDDFQLLANDEEMAEHQLDSISSLTPQNLDTTLMDRQVRFESCLSKFLESTRRDAISSGDGARSSNNSKVRHQNMKTNIKNGSNFKKMKTTFRLRKAKTWINANRDNFGRTPDHRGVSPWKKVSTPSMQHLQVETLIRSPDDLRNKLNAMRGARQEHSSPSRSTHSSEGHHNANEERSNEDEDMQPDEEQGPQIEQNSIAEEIARTESELELLIREARLLNSRNEALRNYNKILSEQAKVREHRQACEYLESTAKSLRDELAKLRKNLVKERHQAQSQNAKIHDAKDILLQKKSQYKVLRAECSAMGRVIIGPTYRPPKAKSSMLGHGREEFHWSSLARDETNEEKNVRPTTINAFPLPVPPMSRGEAVESLRELKLNDKAEEKMACSEPDLSSACLPTLKTEAVEEEIMSLGFTDILKTGEVGAGSPLPKLLRYEKYQSCLFGSLI